MKFHGEDCVEAEVTARNAAKVQQHCCSPYVNEASILTIEAQNDLCLADHNSVGRWLNSCNIKISLVLARK